MSRYYKINKNYEEAEKTIKKAISNFELIFGAPDIDPSQAVAHVILGEIYVDTNRYKQALEEYYFAKQYYERVYKDNFFAMNEVSIVLADLAILGHNSGNKQLADENIQILTSNFSADNENVKRAKDALKTTQ
jgi:tetratricopeptide (TPR) repeat protein